MMDSVDGWFAELDVNGDGFLDKEEIKAKYAELNRDNIEQLTD